MGSTRRAGLMAAALVLVTSTTGCPTDAEPKDTFIEAEYVLTGCQEYSTTPHGLPCRGTRSHGHLRIDSARLVLHGDHTGRVMIGKTGDYNSCYMTSPTACLVYDTTYVTTDVVYTLSPDSVIIVPPSAEIRRTSLIATIPVDPPPSWIGPDTISWKGPGFFLDNGHTLGDTWIFTRK